MIEQSSIRFVHFLAKTKNNTTKPLRYEYMPGKATPSLSLSLYIYIYIHMYIHMYMYRNPPKPLCFKVFCLIKR